MQLDHLHVCALGAVVLALTIDDRERILLALDDVRADALAELRRVLLREHEWRRAREPCRALVQVQPTRRDSTWIERLGMFFWIYVLLASVAVIVLVIAMVLVGPLPPEEEQPPS